MKNFYCFAWAKGLIEFGTEVPEGALPIYAVVGADEQKVALLRENVEVLSRLAYDGETLLVPGIPEAADEHAAYDALIRFNSRVKHYMESV
jgi:hypothetical protein